ncbi:hypothetical protein SEA_SKOG_86 [Gordonia phage Skog]|uniref:Uncharacterized protein n=1 Tax=Gordonia phage Skog TaxID=2704033 RepID=A0A6G6XJG7_9CAUD|nr:hypothetical protein KHQ85_gp086 [Gordonia phage Skog]QIG58238.1 hypothetical protein SEA_SKOG_86 [Gordonia phage Skog]
MSVRVWFQYEPWDNITRSEVLTQMPIAGDLVTFYERDSDGDEMGPDSYMVSHVEWEIGKCDLPGGPYSSERRDHTVHLRKLP